MCWDAQGEANLGMGNEEWLESPDSIRGTTKITLLSAMFSTIDFERNVLHNRRGEGLQLGAIVFYWR